MGVATGCGCKEVYRFPHTTYPYSSYICFFFTAASLLFVLFFNVLYYNMNIYIIKDKKYSAQAKLPYCIFQQLCHFCIIESVDSIIESTDYKYV